jgi:hypothetical protein
MTSLADTQCKGTRIAVSVIIVWSLLSLGLCIGAADDRRLRGEGSEGFALVSRFIGW